MTSDTSSGVPLPSERSFGLVFAVLFAALAAYLVYAHRGGAAAASLAAAGALAALALFAPTLLAAPNRLWFKVGMALNAVVSPIVIGFIFFALITPVALALRATGRDELRRKREPAKPSYWIDRTPPGPRPESFRNQF